MTASQHTPEAPRTATLRVGSVCSGVGGFEAGLRRAGLPGLSFEAAWLCEFDPWRRRVLARHFPGVPCYPDIATLDPAEVPPIDVLVGGTPCQDLSVAGRRAGLEGERSGLFHHYVRLRNALEPEWTVWENVPGSLSSNEGLDFALILESFVGAPVAVPAGGWPGAGVAAGPWGGTAWRVLDSQYLGVPQRRRRVFVVSRLGGPVPPEVLLEREGVPGDPAAGDEAREAAAGGAVRGAGGPGARGRPGVRPGSGGVVGGAAGDGSEPGGEGRRGGAGGGADEPDVVQSLTTRFGNSGPDLPDAEAGWLVSEGPAAYHAYHGYEQDDGGVQSLLGGASGNHPSLHDAPIIVAPETAASLTAGGHPGSNAPGRRREDDENLVFDLTAGGDGQRSPALRAGGRIADPEKGIGGETVPVVVPGEQRAFDTFNQTVGDVSPTLRDPNGTFGDAVPAVVEPSCVHADAIARDGVARADSPDAEGCLRRRDAGLGVRDDGQAFNLTTGAPHAVGPVPAPDEPFGFDSNPAMDQPARGTSPPLKVNRNGQRTGSGANALVGPVPAEGAMGDTAPALTRGYGKNHGIQDGRNGPINVVVEDGRPVPFVKRHGAADADDAETWAEGEVARSLNGMGQAGTNGALAVDGVADTLRSHPRPGSNSSGALAAAPQAIRRLTPTECERLQGFPDGWSIPEGPSLADAPSHYHLRGAPPWELGGPGEVAALLAAGVPEPEARDAVSLQWGGGALRGGDRAATLTAAGYHAHHAQGQAVVEGVHSLDSTFGRSSGVFDDQSPPLKVGSGLGIPAPPAVVEPERTAYRMTGDYSDPQLIQDDKPMLTANPMSDRVPFVGPAEGPAGVAGPLTSPSTGRGGSYRLDDHDVYGGHLVPEPAVGFRTDGDERNRTRPSEELSPTLRQEPTAAVCEPSTIRTDHTGSGGDPIRHDGLTESLTRGQAPAVAYRAPALGSDEPHDPKPDGPRYACMGDAVTVPVISWIGRRLLLCHAGADPDTGEALDFRQHDG